jgi:hypothetical protein
MPDHIAFLSYAHRYQAWVKILHRNLEASLAAAARPGTVFLDDVDLASGRSWIGQLQAGLDRAGQLKTGRCVDRSGRCELASSAGRRRQPRRPCGPSFETGS